MPGIVQKVNVCAGSNETVYRNSLVGNGALTCNSFNGSSASNSDFWSKRRDDMSCTQLQKFWCELTTEDRQTLMRIDKQTLFEHARKNMYCSRCNGLLLEDFIQIVTYGKSLQQDATSGRTTNNQNCGNLCTDKECQDGVIDPSLHPWGGLTTSRDGMLTVLDCYFHSDSLECLQNVFDSARARERERKLLYPDACGGGGRGWISQGMTGHGRGHVTREACALHTARLSVDTLVDFWSALGEETRQTLLKMKEEDFIERLMYRFDSKRFCRDCRRNVIREFKELKELKRMRKDPHCTSWFCVADSAFQYEVSHDTVQADWHQIFLDACGTYDHFEWAIGSGEGKSDILDFKDVGLSVRVQVKGLDLSGLSACYITLKACKKVGHPNVLCVKAHALRGQQCVHCRLAVGDGHVTITIGEKIRRFFELAEEAEEEEDDDSMDKDGNELDGECSRPQKHAKSPELAREFLLDAATVIFKEQVEKAFREGTARQNAHSIFVCLALKLLEERVHVAGKEIITLEKQMKLLEEEEKEKLEEEERKERRRTREREKKLRRKERLREKENKEKNCAESNRDDVVLDILNEEKPCGDEGGNIGETRDCARETGEATPPESPLFLDMQDGQFLTGYSSPNMENHPEDIENGEFGNTREFNTSLPYNHYRYSRRKPRLFNDTELDLTSKWTDRRKGLALSESELTISKYESRCRADGFESTRGINCFNKQLRTSAAKFSTRNGPKLSEKLRCTNYRVGDRCDSHVCSCNHHNDHKARPESLIMRSNREPKYVSKLEYSCDVSKPFYRGKFTQAECARDISGRVKTNTYASNSPVTKKVWEPLDSQKKFVQRNSCSAIAFKPKVDTTESDQVPESSGIATNDKDDELRGLTRSGDEENGLHTREKSDNYIKVEEAEDGDLCFMTRSSQTTVDSLLRSSSNSDNCSSCLSEGDSNTSSSNCKNLESTSTSDSEESSQTSEGRDMLRCLESRFVECHKVADDQSTRRQDANNGEPASGAINSSSCLPAEPAIYCESSKTNVGVNGHPQSVIPAMMNNQNMQYPIYQAPTMGYYHQSPVSWPAGPTNGLMSFHYSNHYLYANSFGYDLNSNAQFMQYGGLQHLTPPLINHVHMPVFPPVTQANVVCTKDHVVAANPPGLVKEVCHSIQTTKGRSAETPAVGDAGQTDEGNNNFSLFHFGGPVAFSTGVQAEAAVALKEGAAGDGIHPCNRKDSIEEYNLFAASNGITFSIL